MNGRNRSMTEDSTMAMPKVDMDSPRIIAAMKVTGIEPSDITEFKEVDTLVAQNEESQARRVELMQRKRRQLLKELDDTAAALDESLVEAILSPSAVEAEMRLDAHASLDVEKRKIDSKRERAKMDMLKELEKEMGTKTAFESTKKGKETWRQRLVEINKDKQEKLSARAETISVRGEKQGEALRKTRREDWNQKKDLMKKITDTNDRVTKQAEQRRLEWDATSEERSKKIAEIVQKSMDIQKGDEEDKLKKFQTTLTKQREREDRMMRVAEEALTTKRAKCAEKMDVVTEVLQGQQKERERVFMENSEKLERARKAGKDYQAEMSEKTRTAREKEMEKWLINREARRKETRERMTKIKSEITDSHTKSVEVREKYLEDTVYKQAQMKGLMEELVDQNKARISRSDDCAREQTLAKIRHTKDKIDTHVEQKRKVVKYRADALRDEMVGRNQLHDLKKVMQTASTKRINELLKDLDMPLLPVEPVKEEGEDDKKQ